MNVTQIWVKKTRCTTRTDVQLLPPNVKFNWNNVKVTEKKNISILFFNGRKK